MATKPYARLISDAQVMVSGLRNNASAISHRGLDMAFTDDLDAIRIEAAKLNDEQEKLKADTKLKTAELTTKITELTAKMSEARKLVKLDFPQPQWVEFGIEVTR